MSKDQQTNTTNEGNPSEIFKNLLETLQNVKNNQQEDDSDSSSDEGDEQCESECSDYQYDDENTKLKLFNSLLESHRLLCEAFSKLYKD